MWNALTYDAKESAMRKPAGLDTFWANLSKVTAGEFNHNIPRVALTAVLDTVGAGTGLFEKDATTAAAKEAERLTSADFGPKTEREEMAEIDHEGTPKWRIAGSLIRLMRFGHDITPDLEKYKAEGILTAEDTQRIVSRGEKLYIEDRLERASLAEIAQTLRFTTPYAWFVEPFQTKFEKNREIERLRLIELLKEKANTKGRRGQLTAEDEKIISEFLPGFTPEKTKRDRTLEAARDLLERKKAGEDIRTDLSNSLKSKLISKATAQIINRGGSDSLLYMSVETDPRKLASAFNRTQNGDEQEQKWGRKYLMDKFYGSTSTENRKIYLDALKQHIDEDAWERLERYHVRKSIDDD